MRRCWLPSVTLAREPTMLPTAASPDAVVVTTQLMAADVNVIDGQASLPTLLLGRSAALSTFHQPGATAASEPPWELYKRIRGGDSQGFTKLRRGR